MSKSLAQAIQEAGSPVKLLRNSQAPPQVVPPPVPVEYSNWQSEQLSWRDSCGLLDQSHHMVTIILEGPDIVDFLSRIGVNSFKNYGVDKAKHFIGCTPDGHLIGQGILFQVQENKALLVGAHPIMDWVEYNHAATANKIKLKREGTSLTRPGDPSYFRYQLQGPRAISVMRDCLGEEPPELRFFHMGHIKIAGRDVTLLRHGMVGAPGFEMFGNWRDREPVLEALLEAGREHNLKQVGGAAYFTTAAYSGYISGIVPGIFTSPELADYRNWLSDRSWAATTPLGGSFNSDNIEDYYFNPFAVGYGRSISFDHDFIGRSALEQMVANGEDTRQKKVTLVWDSEDVVNVTRSFFTDELPAKWLKVPGAKYTTYQYDSVLAGDKFVGISTWPALSAEYRRFLSTAIIDSEYAEDDTELSLLWGEDPNSAKPGVEPHKQVKIKATVAPAPFFEYARTRYRQD